MDSCRLDQKGLNAASPDSVLNCEGCADGVLTEMIEERLPGII